MKVNAKFFWITMVSGAFIGLNLGLGPGHFFPLFFLVPAFVLSLLGYIFTVDR